MSADEAILELAVAVREHTGLDFVGPRRDELLRELDRFLRERGGTDLELELRRARQQDGPALLHWLIPSLAVGETYFFRHPDHFASLKEVVLPALVKAAGTPLPPLRIWSAAASTGEEAYSLAITALELYGETAAHRVEIVATDLNPVALERAQQGLYGEWSFRGVEPRVRKAYFEQVGASWRVRPEVRRLVRFAPHNLLFPGEPGASRCCAGLPLAPDRPITHGRTHFEIVFCRNVLQYYGFDQAKQVVGQVVEAMSPTGFLFVAPCEADSRLFEGLTPRFHGDSLFFERGSTARPVRVAPSARAAPPPPLAPRESTALSSAHPARRCAACADPAHEARERAGRLLLAAARGRRATPEHVEQWCARAAAAAPSSPEPHLLAASVALEARRFGRAEEHLKRALELDPELGLTRYLLAELYRLTSRPAAAVEAATAAQKLLAPLAPASEVPGGDGATAGQLRALAATIVHQLSKEGSR